MVRIQIKSPQVWRMFADEDHFQWQFWIETGVMSIGWGQRTEIKNIDDYNDVIQIQEKYFK